MGLWRPARIWEESCVLGCVAGSPSSSVLDFWAHERRSRRRFWMSGLAKCETIAVGLSGFHLSAAYSRQYGKRIRWQSSWCFASGESCRALGMLVLELFWVSSWRALGLLSWGIFLECQWTRSAWSGLGSFRSCSWTIEVSLSCRHGLSLFGVYTERICAVHVNVSTFVVECVCHAAIP